MPEMPVHRTTRRVEFSDTDMAGIMHFARFFHYIEQAEHEFLRSRGLSVILEWEGRRIGFPRVSAHCDYQSPLRFEEVFDITLEVNRVGDRSITYKILFTQGDRPIATGMLVVCCVVDEGGRMVAAPIPESFKARLLGA